MATFVERVSESDILVNNLGIFEPEPFGEITDEDWATAFRNQCDEWSSPVAALLAIYGQPGWGRIVFISSESALNISVEMFHYGMTKTAQLAIARGAVRRRYWRAGGSTRSDDVP